MKKLYPLLIALMLVPGAWASVTVTGKVTAAADGEPVIGASVVEKGTSNGTITDFEGNYSITVADKATLVFSYVGMTTLEQRIAGPTMNVRLKDDAIAMEEVVVTAMGIVQEKKRMNFAVQNVKSEDLTAGKNANFVNALQGQIAGVQVTNSSGSPNAGSQIIIRGITSINSASGNEPLFVLDGVPIRGGATAAADINPNDIENVTVLKGAAASALYGHEAMNGVIMITTKGAQAGKMQVTANASVQIDTPTRLLNRQTSYAPGANGFFREKTSNGWGPLLLPGQETYNSLKDFLHNGLYQKYDASITGGTEKLNGYASVNWSKADGVIPEDYKQRFGALLKGSFSPAKWVTINASMNFMSSRSRSTSGISAAYGYPLTYDILDYETADGFPKYRYYADGEGNKYASPTSPLYSIYHDGGQARSMRMLLNGSIVFKPVKGLELTGRVSYDLGTSSSESYKVPRWDFANVTQSYSKPEEPKAPEDTATQEEKDAYAAAYAEYLKQKALYDDYQAYLNGAYQTDSYLTSKERDNIGKDGDYLGAFSASTGRSELLTAGFLASYKLELPKDFGIDFLVGGELKSSKGFSTSNYGVGFVIPGTYSLKNTNPAWSNLSDQSVGHSGKNSFGYFYEVRFDYKGLASISTTGRVDWSSALLTSPYFYPSVTAGLVFSELIPGLNETKNNWFSYGKLRGNYAKVGKDCSSYLYDRRFKQFTTYPDGGWGIDPTLSSATKDLQPEMMSSWEIGLDLRFFDNKTRFDFAYYSTMVDNQIVTVRVSPASGHILQTRNEGSIRNQGFEFTWDQNLITTKNFKWGLNVNLGLNRGKVVSLPEGVAEITGPQYGDIFTSACLGQSTTSLTGKDYLRTDEGQIIVDQDGYPMINPNKNMYIGNREPLFSAGLKSAFDIYGVQFSFLFDGRVGGDVANVTGHSLLSSGMSAILEQYRGRQVVFDGVMSDGNGGYVKNTKPVTLDPTTITNYIYNVSTNFIEDGSYLRLSYVTLSYDFARLMKRQNVLKGLNLAFTANNLFMLTRYTGTDPMCNASTGTGGTGSAGIDNMPIPSIRSYNFSLNVKF
ncbi:MAG: SusC/RagA family TonB-linked outer membrane protein [Paludibacteraceae bacterium]|nr:SusC/RagA family TonB-linked outer membrane protein [Paludibacteraceae bacterium]